MKRDLDLLRDLLSVIEMADYDPAIHHSLVSRTGLHPNDPRVQYHLRLLHEAGLVRGVGHTSDGAVSVRLTWQGHEFLEMARNHAAWEHAKNYVIEKTQGLSASALQKALTNWSQNAVCEGETWRPIERRRLDLGPPAHRAPASSNGASKNGAVQNGAVQNGVGSPGAGSVKHRETPGPHYTSLVPPRWPSYHPWEIGYTPDSYFQFHVFNGYAADTTPVYTPY